MKIRFTVNKEEIPIYELNKVTLQRVDDTTYELDLGNLFPLEELKIRDKNEIGWRLWI